MERTANDALLKTKDTQTLKNIHMALKYLHVGYKYEELMCIHSIS